MRMESFFSPFFFRKKKKKILDVLDVFSRVCVLCAAVLLFYVYASRAAARARVYIYIFFTNLVSSKIQQLSLSCVHWLRIRVLSPGAPPAPVRLPGQKNFSGKIFAPPGVLDGARSQQTVHFRNIFKSF